MQENEEKVVLEPVKKKKKKNNNNLSINILVFFLGVLATIGGIYLFKDELFKGETTSNGICYTACENKVTITENGISAAVDKIYDAVVLVQNYKNDKVYSTGTGFVYKVDNKYGYILTNYHVINGNTSIKIVLSDDTEVEAKYLGGDEYIDVAVLAITKDKVLGVAEIGNSTTAKLGDTVFTVGTPVDYEYRGTVTRGILSGKDRLVSVSSSLTNSTDSFVMKVLQTDAAINPGNSGGPLVNSNGKVIGINSLKLAKEEIEGMGFAIPIEDVMVHIETFENGDKIKRPILGVSMINVGERYALYQAGINIDTKITEGVVVVSVVDNSSVDGILKAGDVITKINNEKVSNVAYLRYELFKHTIGDKIKITFIRNGNTKTEEVTLKG